MDKTPIKKHRVAKLIQKQEPNVCSLQENHLIYKDIYTDGKWRDEKKVFHSNENQKKSRISHLYTASLNFQEELLKNYIKQIFLFRRHKPHHWQYVTFHQNITSWLSPWTSFLLKESLKWLHWNLSNIIKFNSCYAFQNKCDFKKRKNWNILKWITWLSPLKWRLNCYLPLC